MKRPLAISVILLFFGMIIFPSSGIQIDNKPINPTSRDNTLYVGGNGSGNYSKIQDAIDNASNGDTVFVYSGIYNEWLTVKKTIDLIGEDKNTTIIDSLAHVILIKADWVNLSGFTIHGNNYWRRCGIILYNSSYNTISYNNILNNWDGINLEECKNNIIKCNTITSNNENGIRIFDNCKTNIIINNTIISNDGDGIFVEYCFENNIIKNNNISLNGEDGIHCDSNNITIVNNLLISNKYSGITLSGISSSNLIFDNIIKNNKEGIDLWYSCNNNIIKKNNLLNNSVGIRSTTYSSNNIIYHNNFIKNTQNAYDECDNIWDDGKYGNYWSDYEKRYPDAKPRILKPWMWNTPYEIPGGDNKDNCPLVDQWPKSKSKDIPTNNAISISPFLRFLERYPMLQALFTRLYLQ